MNLEFDKVKIFVTVPEGEEEKIRNAVCEVGAGVIGNYTYCSYMVNGVGTFIPNYRANPHIGTNGELECVNEVKLEFVCDVKDVKNVIANLRNVHPYEEPAIDIVPLLNEDLFD